jgi:uncharacterized oligopeptide transporter (OPT) family protein
VNLPIPLAEVFTAAGVVTWAAALAGIVELAKRALPFIPDSGRGVLYLVMGLSAAVIGLAAWEVGFPLEPATLAGLFLSWAALVTAASGAYEVAAKGGRILQGTTNTTAADTTGPVSG